MKTTNVPGLFLQILLVCALWPAWSAADTMSNTASVVKPTPEVANAQWEEIKNLTFDQREIYFAGLKKILGIVDAQADELDVKRRSMSNRSETVDWDLALKEFQTTREYLKSMSREATKATVKEWDHTKEKMSQAWTQTQDAYDKARLSTPK